VTGKRWTEDEMNVIRDNYEEKTDAEIASMLENRTKNAVSHKRRKMGLYTEWGAHLRLAPGEAAFNVLYRIYRDNAKSRGIPFELTKEQFREIVNSPCYYCGREPSMVETRGYGNFVHNGVDRFWNNRPYTVKNCVPCCKECNRAKRDMTPFEFIRMCYLVSQNHGPVPQD